MENITEIQIVQIEIPGWEKSPLGCYILSDSNLLDVITPTDSSESRVKVPVASRVRLIVKSMLPTDDFLGSVSFDINTYGEVALPLSSDISADYIEEIPEDCESPRIIVDLGRTEETQQLHIQYAKLLAVHCSCQKKVKLLEQELAFEKAKKKDSSDKNLMVLLAQKDEQLAELSNQYKNLLNERKLTWIEDSSMKENEFLKNQLAHYKETVEALQISLNVIGTDPSDEAHKLLLKAEVKELKKHNKRIEKELSQKNLELLEAKEQCQTAVSQLKIIEEKYENEASILKNELANAKKQHESYIKSVKEELKNQFANTQNIIDEKINALGLNLKKIQKNVYSYKDSLVEIELVRDTLYVFNQGRLEPVSSYFSRDVLKPLNSENLRARSTKKRVFK